MRGPLLRRHGRTFAFLLPNRLEGVRTGSALVSYAEIVTRVGIKLAELLRVVADKAGEAPRSEGFAMLLEPLGFIGLLALVTAGLTTGRKSVLRSSAFIKIR